MSSSQRLKNLAVIREAKAVPCLLCGREFPYYVMDFDHVRGNKLFNIADRTTIGTQHLLAEIAKCDVLCANCHRIRHHAPRKKSTK